MDLKNTSSPASAAEKANGVVELSSSTTAHLVFDVDAQPYACPISIIQHLIRYVDVSITPSPAVTLTGEIGRMVKDSGSAGIPVISLRQLWGLSDAVPTANENRQAILIVNLAGRPCALLVDSCRCVITRLPEEQGEFHMSSELQSARGRAFKLATRWEDSLLVVLELDRLLEFGPEPVRPAVLEEALQP